MHDNIHAVKRARESFAVAHIPDEIADGGVVVAADAHFVLLQLVAAEDDDFSGMVFLNQDFYQLLAKGTGTSGDQYDFLVPFHTNSLFRGCVFLRF